MRLKLYVFFLTGLEPTRIGWGRRDVLSPSHHEEKTIERKQYRESKWTGEVEREEQFC